MRDRAGLGDDLRTGDERDAFTGLVHGQPLIVLDVHHQRAGFVIRKQFVDVVGLADLDAVFQVDRVEDRAESGDSIAEAGSSAGGSHANTLPLTASQPCEPR